MLDLLLRRRSIRKYEDRPIDRDILDKILLGALTSPSSNNRKPWELVVVEEKEKLSKLGASRGAASAPITRAPMAIVVAAKAEKGDIWIEDCSIMTIIIQLMAESLGLGSCWIQIRDRTTPEGKSAESYVRDLLHLPEEYHVECIISLGYPAETKSPHDVESLNYEKIHYERFKP